MTTAAVTEVSIASLALEGLGRPSIPSFEVASKEARLAKLWYPTARDALLEAAQWTFADARQANLAPLGTAPPWGYAYAFQRPATALKIWEIDTIGTEEWQVAKDQIWCNLSIISVSYTEKVEDPSKFTPLFVVALVKWMEALMAISLTGKEARRDSALKEAQFWLGEAGSSDGQQASPHRPATEDLTRVRY